MSPQLVLFIVVVIFVVGWFAVGTHYNVRKGDDALRWLQEGLPLIGEKTTMQWLGSSVMQLKIQHARAPFHDAEILVVLEPRDVAPLWGIARLRSRRDLFVIRGTLPKAPRTHLLETGDPKAWALGGRLHNHGPAAVLHASPEAAPSATTSAAAAVARIALDIGKPVRLSVHRDPPHLEIQWRLADVLGKSSRDVLETVRHLAQSV